MKNKTLQDYSEKEEILLNSGDSEAMKAFIEECYRQGHTYFELRSFQEAAEFFQYVSGLDPKYPDIYYHMGIAFYESNNKRQAYIAFKKAIKFDSHNTEIINLMKNVQINLGIEVTEEKTEFERITQTFANSSGEVMTREQETFMKFVQFMIETRIEVEKQGRELNYVNHKLKVTGVNDSYDIAIEVNSLDPQSRSYYNTFSSTLKNTLKACQLVGNDLTAPQTGNAVSPKVQAIKKLLFCGFCGLIADIPFVGIGMTVLHEYVDNLWDCTVEKATTEKMKNISNIVMDKLNYPKALKIIAERLALDFIKLRSEEILTINKNEIDEKNNSLKNVFNLFIKNIPTIPKATLSVVGVKENDEPIIKLALLDVALITKYLYEHHERITASSLPLIEEINNTIILKESFKIQKNNIAHNPLMTLQRDLYHQVECKLSPGNIQEIREKAEKGQWEDVHSYVPLTNYVLYTNAGIKTILEKDSIKNYLKLKPKEELTPKQIEDFRIFAFQEIGKSVDSSKEKHYTCIEKFKEAYSEIINKLVELKTWYFFPNKQIIEICVEDPQLKSQITKQLTDKEWHQSCFNFNPPPVQLIGSGSSNAGDLVDGFHHVIMNS